MNKDELLAQEQARIDDNKNYDMDIYLKIVSWYTNQYTEIDNQVWDLSISVWDEYYVWIWFNSEWDINVQHYWDYEHEYDIDWGWCVEMTDMSDFIESLDWRWGINWAELLELDTLIKAKVDFIYELCFTW